MLHSVATYPPPLATAGPAILLSLALLIWAPRSKKTLGLILGLLSALSLGFATPRLSFDAAGQRVRVLTLNIHENTREAPELLEVILRRRIDVVMLQEARQGADGPAEWLARRLPGWGITHVQETAILSRWKLKDVRQRPLRSLRFRSVLSATVQAPTPFRVVTVHWSAPQLLHGPSGLRDGANDQKRDYEDTIRALDESTAPTILAGDFNCPPANGLMQALGRRYENVFSRHAWGLGWTYPARLPVIRIDHMFVSNGVAAQSIEVGPGCGSDHRCLIADILIAR